jgi:fatty acid desaturase
MMDRLAHDGNPFSMTAQHDCCHSLALTSTKLLNRKTV